MLPVNPAASILGRQNAVLWGRGRRRYYVGDFPGPLSIKTVVRGRAVWETMDGRYDIGPSSYLVLNGGQRYSISVDAPDPVETFCVFFERDYVDTVCRAMAERDERLVDDPWAQAAPVGFLEAPRRQGDAVTAELTRLRAGLVAGTQDGLWADERLLGLATALLAAEGRLARHASRLDAVRPSTRAELLRRLLRARDFAEDNLACPLGLAALAREACLSPWHFHRLFAAAFGETPRAYVSRRRLEHAARLLCETDASVTDVGLAVGIANPAEFAGQFRRRFGSAPRAWRRTQIRKKTEEPCRLLEAD